MGQVLNTDAEQRIMERLRRLPPQQLDEVIQFIDFIAERRQDDGLICESGEIKRSIQILRGRGKGERLVERLLQSRRDNQRQDDR